MAARGEPRFGAVSTFDYVTGSGRTARQLTFALPHDGATIVLSEEHASCRWVSLTELDRTDLTEESMQTIREWEAHSNGTTPLT